MLLLQDKVLFTRQCKWLTCLTIKWEERYIWWLVTASLDIMSLINHLSLNLLCTNVLLRWNQSPIFMKLNLLERESSLKKTQIEWNQRYEENLKRHMKLAKVTSLLLKSGNQKSGKELKMPADMVKTLVYQLLILSKLERRSLYCQMTGLSIRLLRESLKLAASRSLKENQLIGEQEKLSHSHHLLMKVSMCACLVKMLSEEPFPTDTQLFLIKSKTNLMSL